MEKEHHYGHSNKRGNTLLNKRYPTQGHILPKYLQHHSSEGRGYESGKKWHNIKGWMLVDTRQRQTTAETMATTATTTAHRRTLKREYKKET